MYQFRLLLECRWAHLIVWPGEPDRIQLMQAAVGTRSHGISIPSLSEPSSTAGIVFKNNAEEAKFQNEFTF